MAIKNDREYRFLGTFEVEERAETDPDFTVRGYASTFDEYKLFTWDGIDYHERIDRHAFDETDMSDVYFYSTTRVAFMREQKTTPCT